MAWESVIYQSNKKIWKKDLWFCIFSGQEVQFPLPVVADIPPREKSLNSSLLDIFYVWVMLLFYFNYIRFSILHILQVHIARYILNFMRFYITFFSLYTFYSFFLQKKKKINVMIRKIQIITNIFCKNAFKFKKWFYLNEVN